MSEFEGTLRCDGCGVEISLSPIVVGQYHYCCKDCAQGLVCDCATLQDLDETEREKTAGSTQVDAEY